MSLPKKEHFDDMGRRWGTSVFPGGNTWFTFTNENAYDGPGVHVTTQLKGGVKVHDYFDKQGNYFGYNFNTPEGK